MRFLEAHVTSEDDITPIEYEFLGRDSLTFILALRKIIATPCIYVT